MADFDNKTDFGIGLILFIVAWTAIIIAIICAILYI